MDRGSFRVHPKVVVILIAALHPVLCRSHPFRSLTISMQQPLLTPCELPRVTAPAHKLSGCFMSPANTSYIWSMTSEFCYPHGSTHPNLQEGTAQHTKETIQPTSTSVIIFARYTNAFSCLHKAQTPYAQAPALFMLFATQATPCLTVLTAHPLQDTCRGVPCTCKEKRVARAQGGILACGWFPKLRCS